MEQTPLFVEDIYEGLRADIMALGGLKRVGAELWPDKPADQAGILLANCLNRHRPEKLELEQFLYVIRESRKRGSHVAITFTNTETGYAEPIPVEPEDERAKLQREYINAVKALDTISRRMEKVQ